MIIGQDWRPYRDMEKFYKLFNKDKSNGKELIELEKSSTKRILENFIKETSNSKYTLNNIYVRNAMCVQDKEKIILIEKHPP